MSLTIGDKEYTDEELTNVVTQHQEMSQKLEGYKTVQEASDMFGVSPERFVEEARGAIGALVQLQEAGLIDKDGKIVRQGVSNPSPPPADQTRSASSTSGDNKSPSVDEIANAVLAKLNPKISEMEKQIGTHRTNINRFLREKIQEKVTAKGIDVEDEDISLALAESQQSGKDFWEVLGKRAERRKAYQDTAVKAFMEKYGISEDNLNEFREANATDGQIAQALVEGKKIARNSKKHPGSISALEATTELFKRRMR